MNRLSLLLVAGVLALSVAGCSTMKRATGQLDDSVLPGQRENVLPPDQQTARDPNITGGRAAPAPDGASQCAPGEPNCIGNPPAQDASTYTDPVIAEEPPAEPPVVKKPAAKKVAAKKKPVKKKKPIVKTPTPSRTAPVNPDEAVPPAPAPSDQPPSL